MPDVSKEILADKRFTKINATEARFGVTALHFAAAHGHAGVVDRLLVAGSTDSLGSTGRSAAELALAGGHHDVAAAFPSD